MEECEDFVIDDFIRGLYLCRWPEEMLSDGVFGITILWLLTKRERIIFEEKVRHFSDGIKECDANAIIAKDVGITVEGVERYCRFIIEKLKNNMNTQIRRQLSRHLPRSDAKEDS